MWYYGSFVAVTLLALGLNYATRQKKVVVKSTEFTVFQRNYLLVYLLAMFADWLQGPYVYKLYTDYGFDIEAIAQLFTCGFLSSMVVGTFVGGLADRYGRRLMCLVFSLCYSLSALTKLVNNFHVLMLGRMLSGVATSLLFSSFESWMVCEHNRRGFDPDLLGDTFSLATLGNGMIAVLAGLVAEVVARAFGSVGPFMLALVPLACLAALVLRYWPENYGESSGSISLSLMNTWSVMIADTRIMCLGAAQACFEGAMYTFVFLWNPTLDAAAKDDMPRELPLGLIFAAFMVCVMAGSSIFTLLMRGDKLEHIPFMIHLTAALSMGIAATMVEREDIVYISFLVFETCCGVFYPAYGTLRSSTIPEETRATIMNFFRVPLNAFVVVLLLKIKYMPLGTVFFICTGAHLASLAFYYKFYTTPTVKTVHTDA